jgi:hypothetical protein
MKSTADIVMENNAIRIIILSIKIKPIGGLIEIFNKNPNRNTEKVVKMALSLSSAP